MSAKVDRVLEEMRGFSAQETRELISRMADTMDLLGWLKVSEAVFSDWDNEEDAVYDRI